MPNFDGTGPRGLGPMTGAGDGYCVVRVPAGAESAPPLPERRAAGDSLLQRRLASLQADMAALDWRLMRLESLAGTTNEALGPSRHRRGDGS